MRQDGSFVTRFLKFGVFAAAIAGLAACASAPPPGAGAGSGGSASQTTAEAKPEPTVNPNAPLTVALLAPTTASGKRTRAAAQDLTAAAQMARADSGLGDLMLKVYDTKGEPATAAAVASQAIAEGAAVIIGPLLGSSAEAVGPVAEEAGVNVIAFSNNASVAGGNVWILGQLPKEELRRVFGYAAANGVGSIAVAYPTNAYGELMAAEASQAGRDAGVLVGPFVPYERSFQGIERSTKSGAASILNAGSDGVLIADTGDALRSAAAFLDYYNVSPRRVKYLGTSRWADPKNTSETALQGGWFAAADGSAGTGFRDRFRSQMGRNPSRLAGLGYEAMSAVADMVRDARSTSSDQPFSAAAITRGQGFEGVGGRFWLNANGENSRPLAVYEVTSEALIVVDPAGRAPGS